jgi:hypothetical protein
MRTALRPFMFSMIIILIVSLACSSTGGTDAPAATEEPITAPTEVPPPTEKPTDAPPPTEEPTDVPPPTVEPTVGAQDFFTEEFDEVSDIDNWYYFTLGPGHENVSDLKIEQNDDALTLDLGAEDLYLYYIYEPFNYTDVKITMVAENQGVNNNNVALICRFDYDNAEWYEFAFESGGVWYLYAYQNGYNVLFNGGSNDLKQGKAVNEYSMTCKDNVITISINGKELKSYTDAKYNFSGEGQVGFDISSLNVLPVIVNVQSFDIAEP